MIRGKRASLVIPCHNEAAGLRLLLPQVPDVIDEVIVVDNNSTDDTAAIARQYGARIVSEKIPGYGAAYRAGLAAARGEIIATLDGDGQYPVADVPRLVTYLLDHNLDFLSANRFPLPPGVMSPLRQLGNRLLTWAAALLFWRNIHDAQSGMWIFRRHLLARLVLRERGMAFSEEIKLKTIQAGWRFAETPITYLPRHGTSKLAPFADGWENLLYLLRLRLRLETLGSARRKKAGNRSR